MLRFTLTDPIDLAAEFLRWEVATAIAGDRPGRQPVRRAERDRVEGEHEARPRGARAPRRLPPRGAAGLRRTASPSTATRRSASPPATARVVGELRRHLERVRPGGYLAIGAFVAPTAARAEAIDRLRGRLRDATGIATTGGFGPRYLHSTGQLHKGGPAIGWFLQLTSDHPADLPVHGKPYTFGQLIDAQARGDMEALEAHDLPVLRVHLGADVDAGLAALDAAVAERLRQ